MLNWDLTLLWETSFGVIIPVSCPYQEWKGHFLSHCLMKGSGIVRCTENVARCCQAEQLPLRPPIFITTGSSVSSQAAFTLALQAESGNALLSVLCVPQCRIYSGSLVMVKCPLLYNTCCNNIPLAENSGKLSVNLTERRLWPVASFLHFCFVVVASHFSSYRPMFQVAEVPSALFSALASTTICSHLKW